MRNLDDLFRQGIALLRNQPHADLEAKVLLLKATRLSEEKLFSSSEASLSPYKEEHFLRLIGRRLAGVPLSYLTGTKEFWSLTLEVTPSVLIPRPETEALVEKVLELSCREKEAILDLGTGSGNIAIALAKELPKAQIFASDVSALALRVARKNADHQGVGEITFVRSNLFSQFRMLPHRFDFIVSNPPYVSRPEWENLPREIRDFEPRRALLAGESGLEFIRKLVRQAGTFLNPGGHLIFEIGGGQRENVLSLFSRRWMEIETSWDWAGKPRVITARRAQDSGRPGRGSFPKEG